jgi:putative membrane protein
MEVMDGDTSITETEPDHRFTLANERTFLAWIRTSLGFLAGGVAVRQLIEPFHVRGGRTALALLAIAASAVLAGGGFLRWRAVQRAMRRGEPLPPAHLVPVVAVGVVVTAILAFVLVAAA